MSNLMSRLFDKVLHVLVATQTYLTHLLSQRAAATEVQSDAVAASIGQGFSGEIQFARGGTRVTP